MLMVVFAFVSLGLGCCLFLAAAMIIHMDLVVLVVRCVKYLVKCIAKCALRVSNYQVGCAL